MSILDHFTGQPRPGQKAILQRLEETWWGTDVFIIRAPVGSGKSRIAHAISSWAGQGTILTPTNVLVSQYKQDWPSMASMRYRREFSSPREWVAHKRKIQEQPIKVANYMSYLANRLYSPTVIFDEGHNVVSTLQDMEGMKLWESKDPWPDWVNSTFTLLVWAKEAGYGKLAKLLEGKEENYTVELEWDRLRGKMQRCLRVYPLTPRNNRPVFWPPSKVSKLIFMSATFDHEDLYDLGLEGRRVTILDCDNPIPEERRQVIYNPVANMSQATQERDLSHLVGEIERLLSVYPERGLIHCTYSLARKLRETSLGRNPRLRWHAKDNRQRVFDEWIQEGPSSGSVLVGSGMTEGLDLAGWKARWQVITKIMYPNKGDAAVAAKLKYRPRWYAWSAARDLLQSVGRTTRGPGDWSTTYILTSEFGKLYNGNREMFPKNAINLVTKGI